MQPEGRVGKLRESSDSGEHWETVGQPPPYTQAPSRGSAPRDQPVLELPHGLARELALPAQVQLGFVALIAHERAGRSLDERVAARRRMKAIAPSCSRHTSGLLPEAAQSALELSHPGRTRNEMP
jgi:hypothetical protein